MVFNKKIFGNENLLNSLGASEQEIKKLEEVYIFLEKQNRELNNHYNLSELGILLVDLKEILESKTIVTVAKAFNLEKLLHKNRF